MLEPEQCDGNTSPSLSKEISSLSHSQSSVQLKLVKLHDEVNENETIVPIDIETTTSTSNVFVNDTNASTNNNTPSNNTPSNNTDAISELESIIIHKDIEIKKLEKLSAKHERLLEKANKYNEDLRTELSLLSSELHTYRSKSFNNKSVRTQVTETEIEEAYGNKPMPEWGADFDQGLGDLSIADSLKAAAEAELQNQLKNSTSCHHSESDHQNSEADSEYVFDEKSGLYYHSSTGYYWDPNSGLFYDYTSGTYYQYNEATGEYAVHSQVAATVQSHTSSENEGIIDKIKSKGHKNSSRVKDDESKSAKRKLKKRVKSSNSPETKHRRKLKEKEVKRDAIINQDMHSNNEEGELKQKEKLNAEDNDDEEFKGEVIAKVDESSECDSESSSGSLATGESELMSEPESGELTSESSSSDVEILEIGAQPVLYDGKTELAQDYPPCIRVIVQSSEHLKCGSLYIITCTGGSIGRDKNRGHAIEIDDINVSKLHAQITYDYEKHNYTLLDKGSQNGTILNGNRLPQNTSEIDGCDLNHDDVLQIGSTTLLLHIHKGHETCDSCEPGQVQAKLKAESLIKNDYVILSQDEKNKQRRKELKNIKKKYGLQNSYFEVSVPVNTNPDFCDKAYLRRKFIGSESEFLKKHNVAPSSVQSPISVQNKGHKLLAKMGWKEGQGLGKTSSGIAEPINVEMRVNQKAGLGSTTDVSLSLDDVQHTGKAKRWTQARKRYQKLEEDKRKAQTSSSSQMSSMKTVHTSDQISHLSKSLPVSPQLDPSVTMSSSTELHSSTLSSSTYHSSSLLDTATVTPPPVLNPLRVEENMIKTSQVYQSKPKFSWIRGGTEQIGQSDPPHNPSGDGTEHP